MRRVARKRIRTAKDGLSIAADLNAVVSVNRGEPGTTNFVRGESHVRAEQPPHAEASGSVDKAAEADERSNRKESR